MISDEKLREVIKLGRGALPVSYFSPDDKGNPIRRDPVSEMAEELLFRREEDKRTFAVLQEIKGTLEELKDRMRAAGYNI